MLLSSTHIDTQEETISPPTATVATRDDNDTDDNETDDSNKNTHSPSFFQRLKKHLASTSSFTQPTPKRNQSDTPTPTTKSTTSSFTTPRSSIMRRSLSDPFSQHTYDWLPSDDDPNPYNTSARLSLISGCS
jgi:hypothetical protein